MPAAAFRMATLAIRSALESLPISSIRPPAVAVSVEPVACARPMRRSPVDVKVTGAVRPRTRSTQRSPVPETCTPPFKLSTLASRIPPRTSRTRMAPEPTISSKPADPTASVTVTLPPLDTSETTEAAPAVITLDRLRLPAALTVRASVRVDSSTVTDPEATTIVALPWPVSLEGVRDAPAKLTVPPSPSTTDSPTSTVTVSMPPPAMITFLPPPALIRSFPKFFGFREATEVMIPSVPKVITPSSPTRMSLPPAVVITSAPSPPKM